MLVTDFAFELPNELIASYPLPNRSSSRLLVLDKISGKIRHQQFTDLVHFLQPQDLLILNNTKVLAARLFGQKISGGKIEVLIERITASNQALAQVKASKSLKIGAQIIFKNEIEAEVIGRSNDLFLLKFNQNIGAILAAQGHMPLPSYLKRQDELADLERYQTVYAKNDGAVAAPTAGLHFDQDLLTQIKHKGIKIAEVTLHVGAGTFQNVRVKEVEQHQMHSEWCEVSSEVVAQIKACKAQGGKIVAVGTTSARAIESAVINGNLAAFSGETDIFFYPNGRKFQIVDALLTNFHLPQSTLLMLVAAFAGLDKIKNAYNEAIAQKYRFFSYGDAMLIGDNLCNSPF